jgi:hypothetical protein
MFPRCIALVLLLLQVAVGIAPGRVLCVRIGECDTCVAASTCDAGSSCDHECDAALGTPVEHRHGPGVPIDSDSDCDCHVHITVPGQPLASLKSDVNGAASELVDVAVAPVIRIDIDLVLAPAKHVARWRPPDGSVSAAACAIATTRLLI